MATKITDSKFVYGGKSYFRAGCEDINLGYFGEKKTPFGKAPYLYVAGNVNAKNLGKVKVAVSPPYSIEWEKFSDSDVNVEIEYLKAANAQAAFNRNLNEGPGTDRNLLRLPAEQGEELRQGQRGVDGQRA